MYKKDFGMNKYYAGIGSRLTPTPILNKMITISSKLGQLGYILRSGGANGADTAFSQGCTNKQIFLPWNNFNNQVLTFPITNEAYVIAEKYHPGWKHLSPIVKKMMARNAMQILGPDLNEPSQFVICWTADGCTSNEERNNKTGGTGQAIAHASAIGIPVFNLAKNDHYLRFNQFINSV